MSKNFFAACAWMLAFAVFTVATSASAAQVEPTGRTGPYVQANALHAWSSAGGTLDSVDLGSSFGANARVGYRILTHLSLEAQGEWLDEFDVQNGPGGLEAWSAGGNAKVNLGTGNFQVNFLAGLHFLDVTVDSAAPVDARGVSASVGDESGLAVRVGGGIDYYVNNNLYLNTGVEYTIGTGDLEKFNYVTVGLGLGFRM